MKSLVTVGLILVAGFIGYSVGRNSATVLPAPAPKPPAVAVAPLSPRETTAAARSTSPAEEKKADSIEMNSRVPSPQSAEWVNAAREVDRRFGVVYRICSLNPGEHRLVRQLLTRETLIRAKADELRSKGANPEQIQTALAAETARVAELQKQMEEQMPEVARFVGEFKARPVAAVATTDIAERIMIETGNLTPDQLETIFSAASQSELQHPVPEFVNSLRFDQQKPTSVAEASKSLVERNRSFIPEVVKVLDDAQVSAFMAYMEEQYQALNTGGNRL